MIQTKMVAPCEDMNTYSNGKFDAEVTQYSVFE